MFEKHYSRRSAALGPEFCAFTYLIFACSGSVFGEVGMSVLVTNSMSASPSSLSYYYVPDTVPDVFTNYGERDQTKMENKVKTLVSLDPHS
jgi:hypothetical protein